eukprot:6769037-Prymnesium_polylepis.1
MRYCLLPSEWLAYSDLERQMGMDRIHVCTHRARAPVKLKGAERPREASVAYIGKGNGTLRSQTALRTRAS